MDNKQKESNTSSTGKKLSKATRLRILALTVIVVVVAGIFIFKNADKGAAGNPSATKGVIVNGIDYSTDEFALDATENLDLDKLRTYGLPVIIDFGADSCIPCKEMAPVLKELNEELRGKAIVKFVDVWKNSSGGQDVPLSVIPTQFFFNADGTPYVPKDEKAAAAQGFQIYELKSDGKHVFTSHEGGMTKAQILAVLKEMGVE